MNRRGECDTLQPLAYVRAAAVGVFFAAIASAGALSTGPHLSAAEVAPGVRARALLDQYCVTCHNDRLKTSNLSLEKLDLATVGDHPDIWERVVRKLRAGVMPPPDIRRPALADYDALRDFLESELDRRAASRVNPGSVVLHRLNRTEYANVIRDLIGLDIDATTLLPPDDAARGFDNVAGSLTISPTLLEAYTTAAGRVSRMAVGYWKSPTEMTYLAPGDTSQNLHIEGMPLGTRGGMMARHIFPADGEYKFSIQNFGVGSFIPGEQLEIVIDGVGSLSNKFDQVLPSPYLLGAPPRAPPSRAPAAPPPERGPRPPPAPAGSVGWPRSPPGRRFGRAATRSQPVR